MQTNDIYNTCLDISNVLNAGDISRDSHLIPSI